MDTFTSLAALFAAPASSALPTASLATTDPDFVEEFPPVDAEHDGTGISRSFCVIAC
ncbi:hypothetical protein PLICRDRAFT_47006, partial [Plicaturopsis crispa FD-325 SS-3]